MALDHGYCCALPGLVGTSPWTMGLSHPSDGDFMRFLRDTVGWTTANIILGVSERGWPPVDFQTKPIRLKNAVRWHPTFDVVHMSTEGCFFSSWYPLNFVVSYHHFLSFHRKCCYVYVIILVSVQLMLGPVLCNSMMFSYCIPWYILMLFAQIPHVLSMSLGKTMGNFQRNGKLEPRLSSLQGCLTGCQQVAPQLLQGATLRSHQRWMNGKPRTKWIIYG